MSKPCTDACKPASSTLVEAFSRLARTWTHKGHTAQQAQSVMERVSAGGIAAGSQSANGQLGIGNTSRG